MTPTQIPKVNDNVNSEGASAPTFIQGPAPTIIHPMSQLLQHNQLC